MSFSHKAKNWGKVKFNPLQKLAAATPWSQFKSELEQFQPKANENATEEEKAFKKMREQNYRKMLIESKRNEPKIWENFDGEEDETKGSDTNVKRTKTDDVDLAFRKFKKSDNNKDKPNNKRNPFSQGKPYGDSSMQFQNKNNVNHNKFKQNNPFSDGQKFKNKGEQAAEQMGSKRHKKKMSTVNRKPAHIITEEDLVNFDSRDLTSEQNNHMRAAITKASTLKHTNLRRAIFNLKRRNKLQLAKNKECAEK